MLIVIFPFPRITMIIILCVCGMCAWDNTMREVSRRRQQDLPAAAREDEASTSRLTASASSTDPSALPPPCQRLQIRRTAAVFALTGGIGPA